MKPAKIAVICIAALAAIGLALVVRAMGSSNPDGFDFSRIARMTGDFDVEEAEAAAASAAAPARSGSQIPQTR